MQNRRLIINDKEIILSDATRIGVTFQVNNIAELQNRQGSFTNNFRVPLAGSNLAALEFIHVMNSTSLIPYRKNVATYIEDGIEIVSNGDALVQVTGNENGELFAEIEIVSGNVDLFNFLGDGLVGDLYPNYFTWNLSNIVASRDGSQSYIMPLIDWRTDSDSFFTTSTADARYMLPCLRVPDLFEKIETASGFTFTGPYLDSDEHQNMVLTPDELTVSEDSYDDTVSFANQASSGAVVDVLEGSGYALVNVVYTLTTNGTNFSNGSYYPPSNEVASLRFRGTLRMITSYLDGDIFDALKEYWIVVQIKAAGTVLAEKTFEHVFLEWGELSDFVIDVQTDEITLSAGVQHFVNIEVHAERDSNSDTRLNLFFLPNGSFSAYARFERIPKNVIVYGQDVTFRDLMRMKTTEVLKDILLKRGVLIQTNSYKKEIQFNYFQDIINNIPNAIDWSDKIDSRADTMEFKFGSYGQKNNFLFKENDQVTSGLGDYYFLTDDETLDAEVDAVQLKHSATEQEFRYLGLNVPKIKGVDSLWNWNEPGWRILQLDRQETSFNVVIDDTSSSQNITSNVPFARFVGFDSTVPEFYSALQDILNRPKVLNLNVKLDGSDINKLDYIIPIKINRPDLSIFGYFYLNIIQSYRKGINQVQLVRL